MAGNPHVPPQCLTLPVPAAPPGILHQVGGILRATNDPIQPLDLSARNQLKTKGENSTACGLRPRAPDRPGEKNRPERANRGRNGPQADPRSPQEPRRTPASPRLPAKKKANREWLALGEWWRRRESNPRPQVLRPRFYMRSQLFNLTAGLPSGRNYRRRARLGFSESASGRFHRELVRVGL